MTELSSDKDDKYAPYDFRFLRNESGAKYALIVDPQDFGVTRRYYGFIPISLPKGYAKFSLYLVNLSDNSIIGEYQASVEESVNGEWDTPPDYSALATASKAALAKILNDAYIFLFQQKNL